VQLSAEEPSIALEAREARETARRPARAAEASTSVALPATEVLTVGARLLDAEARPLSGAELGWFLPHEDDWQALRVRARADASGAVWLALPRSEFAALPELAFVASGAGTLRRLVRVARERCEGSAPLALGELQLPPGGSVRGRVLDEWGAPLAGVAVGIGPELDALPGEPELVRALARVFPLIQDLASDVAPALTRTGVDGHYELSGLPLGRFMAVATSLASAERVLLPDRVEGVHVEAGAVNVVRDLVLRQASSAQIVGGAVLDPNGRALAGAYVTLVREGVDYAGGRVWSGSDGRFAVLAPEGLEFELRARDPQGRWGEVVRPEVYAGLAGAVLRFE
jgi:hypothetical protein